ncbi:hypothetical protein PMIN06_009249 [Paraphaeosphaeria minitans]|uniref:Uncharacterized protein n=1 Tax=Paraphaeosphaeria minitans TaxID=565426 RepID=A0A9P6KUP3_9PLEO|nr:hypothetical protein PMIN01_01845 [Paraphaeosphaeria minitans]
MTLPSHDSASPSKQHPQYAPQQRTQEMEEATRDPVHQVENQSHHSSASFTTPGDALEDAQHPSTTPTPSHLDSTAIANLSARITALEQENARLRTQRLTAVARVRNTHIVHAEAATAFYMRMAQIEDDDVEGALGAWGTAVDAQIGHMQWVIQRQVQFQGLYRQSELGLEPRCLAHRLPLAQCVVCVPQMGMR